MTKRRKSHERVAFYSITQVEVSEITKELAGKGYDVPSEAQFHHGGGGYSTFGRLIVGGEGSGGGQVHRNSDHEIDYGSGRGFYTLGWLFRIGKLIRIYPLLGLGGEGAGANVRTDTDETAQMMPSPDKKSSILQIITLNPSLSLGVGIEIRLSGILFGIRIGYVFLPLAETREGKPYIRFTVGGGRTR